jgi:light-regulated signal transduction histidine kinase (bacteriophytochrome)
MLDELNQEMDQLLYVLSHDLRAPLRAIDGFSQALIEDCGGQIDETGRDYLERVRKGGVKINEYIDGLLLMSRQSRGDMRIEEVNLSRLAREAGDLVAGRYDAHVPQFFVADGITMSMDRRQAGVLLEKLLDNAWKFTAGLGDARIEFGRMEVDGQGVCFVRDNGVGFDMEYARSRLFGPFQRMHPDQEYPGLGIGLATAKRIINRHGGRIWAESETGKGTTIFFVVA